MGQPEVPVQSKERRTANFQEVAFGYSKKQAVDESRRCPQCATPICLEGCPLGIDIPGFIRLLREGDASAALAKIKEQNPFPSICGRICAAPCESACVFQEEKAPIAVRALERNAADFGKLKTAPGKPTGKTVAIIGSGPAGLTAAHYLVSRNFRVTVFDSFDHPGGLLRTAIPEFRMPKKVLDEEIQELHNLGVVFRTNAFIGPIVPFAELESHYDAILIATGASMPQPIAIPGSHLIGVYYAQEFLLRVVFMDAHRFPRVNTPPAVGSKVVVVGGGYAAFDCARAAVRLGKEATVVFAGIEEELLIHPQDRQQALDEGVRLELLTHPVEVMATDEKTVAGVRCQRLEMVETEGQLELKAQDTDVLFEADTVIFSEHAQPNTYLCKLVPGLRILDDRIWADEKTGMTSIAKVFAAGTAVLGGGFVVDAMASGKRVAEKIKEYLNTNSEIENTK